MNPPSSFKLKILSRINERLIQQETDLSHEIASLRESRDSETKSTVGDKYETARAMAQRELDSLQAQLHRTRTQRSNLSRIDFETVRSEVGIGSLVVTETMTYLLAIGFGMIDVDERRVAVVSVASPVGAQLIGKRVGDLFEINCQKSIIKSIL